MVTSSAVGSLRGVDGVVLAERMSVPVVSEQDTAKVRMAVENDAEHVVALALHPAGAAEDAGERRAVGLAGRQTRAHRQRHARLELLDPRHDLQSLVLPV